LAFLDSCQYQTAAATELPDLEKAVERLRSRLSGLENESAFGVILMSDGQTSTTLLVSGLRRLGADVIYYIPVRGA
jgi:single-stranded DNA-specific DHH superfamily exonuclease